MQTLLIHHTQVAEDYHATLQQLEDPGYREAQTEVLQLPLDMSVS